jgi:hypothetical protein
MLSSIGESVPRGKRAAGEGDRAAQHQGHVAPLRALTLPTGHIRVMSVVPPRYCAPESISSRPSPASDACDSGVAR